jgi:hypothetical protein
MIAAPQAETHTITLLPGAADRLRAMRDKATEPLLHRNEARSDLEADRLMREALLTYHSLVAGLVDLLAASWELGTELFPEPYNDFSMGFSRTSEYHGGLLFHDEMSGFQIHT